MSERTQKQDQTFFVGLKAFIEKQGKILVTFDSKGRLDFPGGKIQKGENNFITALKREVSEETGFTIEVGKPFFCWTRTLPDEHLHAGKEMFLIGFQCKYKSGKFKLSKEHKNFDWVDKSTYRRVDKRYTYFKALENYFSL